MVLSLVDAIDARGVAHQILSLVRADPGLLRVQIMDRLWIDGEEARAIDRLLLGGHLDCRGGRYYAWSGLGDGSREGSASPRVGHLRAGTRARILDEEGVPRAHVEIGDRAGSSRTACNRDPIGVRLIGASGAYAVDEICRSCLGRLVPNADRPTRRRGYAPSSGWRQRRRRRRRAE